MLERIHQEQQDTHTRLKDLECHFYELEAIILRGKQQPVCKDEEVRGSGWDGAERYLLSCPLFTGPSTVLCRSTKVTGTMQTCRSSVSPAGSQLTCMSPCATWNTVLSRLGNWLGEEEVNVFLAGWDP